MVPGLNRSQFLSPTKAQSPDVQPLRMPGTWQLSEWVSSKTLKISREILEILAKSEFLEILAHPFLVTSSLNLIGMFLNWWFLPEQRSTSMKLGPMSWRSYERSVTCLELVANNTRNKFLKSTNKNNTCSMFLQNTNNKIIPAACFYEIPMTIIQCSPSDGDWIETTVGRRRQSFEDPKVGGWEKQFEDSVDGENRRSRRKPSIVPALMLFPPFPNFTLLINS